MTNEQIKQAIEMALSGIYNRSQQALGAGNELEKIKTFLDSLPPSPPEFQEAINVQKANLLTAAKNIQDNANSASLTGEAMQNILSQI